MDPTVAALLIPAVATLFGGAVVAWLNQRGALGIARTTDQAAWRRELIERIAALEDDVERKDTEIDALQIQQVARLEELGNLRVETKALQNRVVELTNEIEALRRRPVAGGDEPLDRRATPRRVALPGEDTQPGTDFRS